MGDHVYGDVTFKSRLNGRTCGGKHGLEQELKLLSKDHPQQTQINELMKAKEDLENEGNDLRLLGLRKRATDQTRARREVIRIEVDDLDKQLGEILSSLQSANPSWGHMMRAGNDESLLAQQVERYACIYTSRVRHLGFYTPFKYFEPHDSRCPTIKRWDTGLNPEERVSVKRGAYGMVASKQMSTLVTIADGRTHNGVNRATFAG